MVELKLSNFVTYSVLIHNVLNNQNLMSKDIKL